MIKSATKGAGPMDAPAFDHHIDIPGTTLFDGEQAMKGFALNKMCYSFNSADNRAEYLEDPEAYFDKYGLNEQQKQACRNKNVLEMIEAGGNIYYLAKFAGIYKLSVQDVGAQQTGMTTEEFKEKLRKAGE
jgi:protocatechuate 4,5-dioxygenase alpha chain